MMRSMAASMLDGSVAGSGIAESGNQRFGLVSRERLVGQSELVVFAALEHVHDDTEQAFIGGDGVGNRTGAAQIIGCDGIGFAYRLDIHHLQPAFAQHVQVLRYGLIKRSAEISSKLDARVFPHNKHKNAPGPVSPGPDALFGKYSPGFNGCRSSLPPAWPSLLRDDTGSGRSRTARGDAATCSESRTSRSRYHHPVLRVLLAS